MTSVDKFQIINPEQIERPTSHLGSLFLGVFLNGKTQFEAIFNEDTSLLLRVSLLSKAFYNILSDLLFPRLTRHQLDIASKMVSMIFGDQFGWTGESERRHIETQNSVGKVAMCWYAALKLKTHGIHVSLYESLPAISFADQFTYWTNERAKFQKHFDSLLDPALSRAEVPFLPYDSEGHGTNTLATHRCCKNWAFSELASRERNHYGYPPTMPHAEFQVEWIIVESEWTLSPWTQTIASHVKQQVNAELSFTWSSRQFPHRYQRGEINSALLIFTSTLERTTGPKNIQLVAEWFARVRLSVRPNFKLTVLSYMQNGCLNSPTPAQIAKSALFEYAKVSPIPTTRRGPGNRLIYEPDWSGVSDESFNHIARRTDFTVDICKPNCDEHTPVRFQSWNFTYQHRTLPTPEDFVSVEELPLLDTKGAPIEVYNRRTLGNLSAVLEKNGDYFWFQVAQEFVSRSSPAYHPNDNGEYSEDVPMLARLLFLVDGRVQPRQSIDMDEKGVIAHFYNQFHAMTGIGWDQRHLANKSDLWKFTGRSEVPVALRGGILRNAIKREKSRDQSPTRKPNRTVIDLTQE